MEDYPRNLAEFERRFATDEVCRDYLMHLRWPAGFRCPRCGDGRFWPQRVILLHCAACDYQSSVIAGTIFQDTHAPLTLWFRAMWYITSQKNGTSALGLQRILGLGSYRTAWAWLHKLRRAMVRPGRDRLQGRVEVDETFVGGEGVDRARLTRSTVARGTISPGAIGDVSTVLQRLLNGQRPVEVLSIQETIGGEHFVVVHRDARRNSLNFRSVGADYAGHSRAMHVRIAPEFPRQISLLNYPVLKRRVPERYFGIDDGDNHASACTSRARAILRRTDLLSAPVQLCL